jgi:hypothetical protein
MSCSRLPVVLSVLALLTAACTPENDLTATPLPVPQRVVDSAPYVCELVPAQAFRMVSGVTEALVETTDGDQWDGDCWAPDTTPRHLEVRWLQEGAEVPRKQIDFVLNDRRKVYTSYGGVTLPTDLGEGWAAYLPNSPFANQPYRVVAKFSCDGKERLVTLYLAQIAKGRDATKDLIELMRIAQKRYGELYSCTPGT